MESFSYLAIKESLKNSCLSEWMQAMILILGDVLSAFFSIKLTSFLLAFTIDSNLYWDNSWPWVVLWIFFRLYQGFYPGYGRSPQNELRLHIIGTFQIFLVQVLSKFTIGSSNINVFNLIFQWACILVLSVCLRYFLRSILIHSGLYGRSISIIGAGKTAALAIMNLNNNPSYGLKPVVAYDDNPSLRDNMIEGIPIVGSIKDALDKPRTQQAIILIPGARAEIQQSLVNSIYHVYPITWVVPDLLGIPNQALQPHNVGSIISLEVKNNLRNVRSRLVKRTIDFFCALLIALLISPMLFLIVLIIRIDSPGPAVYRARRLGRDGQFFDCFKFRSMHSNADIKLREVLDANPDLRAEFEATHKLRDDPRVTRIGVFLRKTSLDEFPQLFNVIRGEMSLVGPRPIVKEEIKKYGDVYEIYKQVRPGMTGYWQANGRSDTSYDERVAMDKFYVTNWTPWLDIIILLKTVKVVLLGKGAY